MAEQGNRPARESAGPGARVRAGELPSRALLSAYAQPAHYTDCFACRIPRPVSLSRYAQAFYTSGLFRLERGVLRIGFGVTSSDAQLQRMLAGESPAFAAWTVEARADDQILLCDLRGRTRSWLMVDPQSDGCDLYFGSAVVGAGGQSPWWWAPIASLHRLYSRALLTGARRRLLA